ncbi:MAG: hypothetical protein FWB73_02215 [Treponema sp.]|nr:hypothetical protein [Treponema sp.]
MKISRLIYIFALLIIISLISISCSRSKPEIAYGFLKLILYQDDSELGYSERFSFFILPEDDDGLDNLDELYVYHDRDQLRWRMKSDEWVNFKHEGKDWIGTRSLSIHDGHLPKGVFRAVLVNKGGESSERNFTFDGNVKFPFPDIEIVSGVYTINSEWPLNKLICYDRTGNYFSTIDLYSLSGNISSLNLSQTVRSVALWTEDEENFCSAVTNAVIIGN